MGSDWDRSACGEGEPPLKPSQAARSCPGVLRYRQLLVPETSGTSGRPQSVLRPNAWVKSGQPPVLSPRCRQSENRKDGTRKSGSRLRTRRSNLRIVDRIDETRCRGPYWCIWLSRSTHHSATQSPSPNMQQTTSQPSVNLAAAFPSVRFVCLCALPLFHSRSGSRKVPTTSHGRSGLRAT